MPVTLQEMTDFVRSQTGTQNLVNAHTRIVEDIGCIGDDFFELIQVFSIRFQVNIDSYLWYFHSPEETSLNLGALLFKPPNKLVKRIPITVEMLVAFANKGVWDIKYPVHQPPKHRIDLYITWALISLLLLFLLFKLLSHST